jgi:hypothetical protein
MPRADKSGLAPVNDVKLYYAVFNEQGKDPVILLDGGFVSSDEWGFEVPLLAKTLQVIVVAAVVMAEVPWERSRSGMT